MNQILVSEKLYVTPTMKKKKKFFKLEFALSVIALVSLSTYGIYASYDRNKNEQVSQEILSSIEYQEQYETVEEQAKVIIMNKPSRNKGAISLDKIEDIITVAVTKEIEVPEEQKIVAGDGTVYYAIGQIDIPKISCSYPILSSKKENYTTLLKISPCKFWGPNPNEIGNFCIVGHNYKNEQFFSKVPTLENGDIIQITDLFGNTVEYEVYDKYVVLPTNTDCTSQLTNGKREITLITCTNDNKQRVIVKATEKD